MLRLLTCPTYRYYSHEIVDPVIKKLIIVIIQPSKRFRFTSASLRLTNPFGYFETRISLNLLQRVQYHFVRTMVQTGIASFNGTRARTVEFARGRP